MTVYFPKYAKSSHGHLHSNKISPAQCGSCAKLETPIVILKLKPTETEEGNEDQNAVARGVK